MPPRDVNSLLTYLENHPDYRKLTRTLLPFWGPQGRPMKSTRFLPPRLLAKNQDTIEDLQLRTITAGDGTRHSPAQISDAGEMFAKMHYRLGNSDLMRQLTGADYEGILSWLGIGQGIAAAARFIGIFDAFIIQAFVQHDELANWEAIEFNTLTRRGDNAYFEYQEGPDLDSHRVAASGDWTDPDFDPWTNDIIPRINHSVQLGYSRSGIVPVCSDMLLQTLAENPFTAKRLFNSPVFNGQTLEEAFGPVDVSDVGRVFQKIGVQAPMVNDDKFLTKTGQKRSISENSLIMVASTGRTEVVNWNLDDPTQATIVNDTLGFNGIGTANGQTSPGVRTATRAFTNQKDCRFELEGWQSTGPIILEPQAVEVVKEVDLIS